MRHALPLQQHFPTASPLAYGCMGLGGHWDGSPWISAHVDHAQAAVEAASLAPEPTLQSAAEEVYAR